MVAHAGGSSLPDHRFKSISATAIARNRNQPVLCRETGVHHEGVSVRASGWLALENERCKTKRDRAGGVRF